MTCGRRFGGYGHEEIDAMSYAAWGIDLLKYDYCYAPPSRKEAEARYSKMGNALKHSGRSIVFSICEWGFRKPWQWTEKVGGHYARSTPDIMDVWKGPKLFVFGMMPIVHRLEKVYKYAGPGHWNDGDMLIVGNYGKGIATGGGGLFKGMNDMEYQSHFSLWSMFSVPLLTSNDLRKMNDATANILTNPEVLDIDQDELGEQAKPIYKLGGIRVYMKHLKDGGIAVAVLNTSKSIKVFKLKPSMLGFKEPVKAHDVWNHTDIELNDVTGIALNPHETFVFRISK
jgi:alpha-galactosidase